MIEIIEKTKCCGCTACVNACPEHCITMAEDQEGFLYPKANTNECVQCHLCENVCPIISYEPVKKSDWKQKAFVLQHKDNEICRQSTAGGAFTAIAESVIEQGGTVFGATFDSDFSVVHSSTESKANLIKFRNSKYVQSKLGDTYAQVKKLLNESKLICYSGTPCQIEGLRHYLRKDYENLVLVDVVCRAVPSPGIWEKYLKMETNSNGKIASIRFRDKTLGYQYSTMEMIGEDGKVQRGGIESQKWLRMFFSGMIIRPSCTECRFRDYHRNSDFTIWDCFDIYDIDRNFDEDRGTTRLLIHNEKGMNLFDSIKKQFLWKEISTINAIADVDEMRKSPIFNPKRKAFYQDLENMEMDELLQKYYPDTVIVKTKRIARIILNRIGLDKTIKHILRGVKG